MNTQQVNEKLDLILELLRTIPPPDHNWRREARLEQEKAHRSFHTLHNSRVVQPNVLRLYPQDMGKPVFIHNHRLDLVLVPTECQAAFLAEGGLYARLAHLLTAECEIIYC